MFVCESVPASLRVGHHSLTSSSRPVLSLYTSMVLDVLAMANPVTEELMVRLVPYMEEGLKWKSLEYKASTYMVVSQLAALVHMEDKLVVYLVERVSKVSAAWERVNNRASFFFSLFFSSSNLSLFASLLFSLSFLLPFLAFLFSASLWL